MDEQRYLEARGGACPFCGSEDIMALHEESWVDDRIIDPIQCRSCGSTWADVYVLTHIMPYPLQ